MANEYCAFVFSNETDSVYMATLLLCCSNTRRKYTEIGNRCVNVMKEIKTYVKIIIGRSCPSCDITSRNNPTLFIPLSLRTEHRALTVPRHPRLLFQCLGSIRHLVGLLGGGISPAQGLYLHRTTQHRKTQTHIHAPNRIRTCDPNVRAAEDSRCLRPLGHLDRRIILHNWI
jgi:hypothetical protein